MSARARPRPTSLRVGVLHRAAAVATAAVNREARTLDISFSSEEPVSRWFGQEILGHSNGEIDLSRLNNRAAFLLDHNSAGHIGVVERAWVEAGRGRAQVRLGKSARAEEILADVAEGIRSKISVGYRVKRYQLEETGDDTEDVYRAVSWEPFELSLVSIPADDSVGVGRAADASLLDVPVIQKRSMDPLPITTAPAAPAAGNPSIPSPAPATPPAPPAGAARYGDAPNILALGERMGRRDEAMRAIAEGSSLEEYVNRLRTSGTTTPPETPGHAGIGMTPREVRRFSICRALAGFAENGRLGGFELEASQAFATRFGLKHGDRSFFIPWEVQQAWTRDLAAGAGATGGVTVQTDVLGNELIELLRARLISGQLGVRTMFGLQGNVSIPLVSTGATGAWLAEAAPITPSNQTFGQVPLVPKRYGAATAYSRQLVVQSTIDVEGFVRNDLAETVAHAFDLAVIAGSGAGGQPTGILNTSGIGTVTFAGPATWAKVLEFETSVANANADFGALAYLTTPATRGKWKAIPKVTGTNTGGFLWQDSGFVPVIPAVGSPPTPATPPVGLVNGYRAIASTIVPTNRVIFANWNDAILAMWIPLEVVVDPYSLALNHQVRVVVNALGDVAVRHAASFCASTDTGAA